MSNASEPNILWSKYAFEPRDDGRVEKGSSVGYVLQAEAIAKNPVGFAETDILKAANILAAQGQTRRAARLRQELMEVGHAR